jgi:hypothetical protein
MWPTIEVFQKDAFLGEIFPVGNRVHHIEILKRRKVIFKPRHDSFLREMYLIFEPDLEDMIKSLALASRVLMVATMMLAVMLGMFIGSGGGHGEGSQSKKRGQSKTHGCDDEFVGFLLSQHERRCLL